MRTLIVAALLALTQSSDGIIEVTVRDLDTRQEIPAVRVTVSLLPTQQTQPASFTVTSFTDSRGFAEFKNLVHGVYQVQIERVGYAPGTNSDRNRVFVYEGTQRFKVELDLSRAITVSGRVLKPDGTPLAKAHVSPLLPGYRDGRRVLNGVSSSRISVSGSRISNGDAYTNEGGEYRLEGLPPGAYYIRVDSGGFKTDDRERDARIAYYPGVSRTADAVTVNPGGQDASGIDIRMPNLPAFKVSGTLAGVSNLRRADGTTVPPATNSFYLVSLDPANMDTPEALYLPNVATEVPGESRFEIRGVVPGAYYLLALANLGPSVLVSRVALNVEDRDVTDLRLVLSPVPEVKGRILVDGDPSVISWGSVAIGALPKEPLPLLLYGVAGNGTMTQATGEFTLPGLVEDIHYVPNFYGLPPDAYVADLRQGGLSTFNNGATIRSNAASGPVEIHVGLRGGTVQGVVRNASSQGVVRAAAVLVPSSPRRDNPLLYKEVSTDDSGRFSFRGVAPGEYKVFAWAAPPRVQAYRSEEFLANFDSRGVSVSVTAGATSEVQVPVLPLP